MLKRTARVAGSYLLNQRVVPDWWHPYRRGDALASAKETLAAAFRLDRQSLTSEKHIQPKQKEGVRPDVNAQDVDSDSLPHNTQTAATLSLYEVNALVATFASSHDVDGLSSTLQYLRENLHQDLTPYHYHALFRVFNHTRDRDNVGQLLEVMAQRGETTLESYARAADCIATLASIDSLPRILETVHTAQLAFGTLVCEEVKGSEGATVAAYGAGSERVAALEEPSTPPGPSPPPLETNEEHTAHRRCSSVVAATCSAPVLTSLLQYVAISAGTDIDPVAALLTALWIRALGVPLSDWDWVHVMTCLLTHVEAYPRVRALLGTFSSFPRGEVSPNAVLERLGERGELSPGYATAALSLPPQTLFSPPAAAAADERAAAASTGTQEGATRAEAGAIAVGSAYRPLDQIAAAMRHSLTAAGIDMNQAVPIGFINNRCTSLRSTIQEALKCMSSSGGGGSSSSCAGGQGLGAHGYNAALLYHTLSIVHSSLRDNSEAARLLVHAAETELKNKTSDDDPSKTGSDGALGGESMRAEDGDEVEERNGEPFAVGFQYVMDIGSLLPQLSMRTREEVREPFTQLVHRMLLQQGEGQLQATCFGDGNRGDCSDTSAAETATRLTSSVIVSTCAATPPLVPAAADLVGVESYSLGFMRTYAEASIALQRAVARVDRTRARLPREVRLAFKQLAQFSCDHPLPNPKLTAAGLAERRKWAAYLHARDTALSLFGSAKQARDAMRHVYYHDGKLAALRSEPVIVQDFADTARILFGPAKSISAGDAQRQQQDQQQPQQLPTMADFTTHRTTQPHIRCCPHVVPPYLYDPAVYNPYPHTMLRRAPVGAAQLERESAALKGDFFAELWSTLMNPTVMGADVWYLRNTDMYLLLMRCLLHRLDWEAAAHLTAKMLEHSSYTYLMDHELTTIFREIGDPAGCLAFKVATKLFDGRITRDGQPKRERFHQEQFQ